MKLDFIFYLRGVQVPLTVTGAGSNDDINTWRAFFRNAFKNNQDGSVHFDNVVIRLSDLSAVQVWEHGTHE